MTFFDHWSANRIDAALAMLSDDVLYDNIPFPDIVGRENVRKFHSEFGIGTSFTIDWKVINIAASGNVVLKRTCRCLQAPHWRHHNLPVMGTVTVEGEQITVWRDYFDPTEFDRQLSQMKQ